MIETEMLDYYSVLFEHLVTVPLPTLEKIHWCKHHVGIDGVDWQWCYTDAPGLIHFGFRDAAAATLFALRWL